MECYAHPGQPLERERAIRLQWIKDGIGRRGEGGDLMMIHDNDIHAQLPGKLYLSLVTDAAVYTNQKLCSLGGNLFDGFWIETIAFR